MSKRNISFTKPPEPEFIRRMKEKVGFQEGPTVDTKREANPVSVEDDDYDDESPTIVVLKEGDLTAEEYYSEIDKEEETKKADLSQKPVFQKPKRTNDNPLNVTSKKLKTCEDVLATKSTKKTVKNTSLLSFQDDEEDEN